MMNVKLKNKIKFCFNKAVATYDHYCAAQQFIGLKAIELLQSFNQKFTTIADIGCGTGISTQLLINHISNEKIFAIDFSEKLLSLAAAKINSEKVNFILADFDDILFQPQQLDLAFCNMSFQWSLDLKKTLRLFYNYLASSNGLITFTLPLAGTFSELKPQYRNYCYHLSQIESLLSEIGFQILSTESHAFTTEFSSELTALRSIKAIGANCRLDQSNLTNRSLAKKAINDFFISPNQFNLTYQLGIFIAKKIGK